ncbi:MAG: hypothetical protein HXY22_06235 [Alphaproteobacteria bacterium]|nr:hypothetical protein [Alphaproteobacteria bacterium]
MSMSLRLRFFPTIAAGAALLLVVKVADIANGFTALAEEAAPATHEPAQEPAPAADQGAGTAAPREDAADPGGLSPSEIAVLESLGKRRQELDAIDKEQQMREQLLAATEKRVNERIAELKTIKGDIEALLGKRDEEAERQLADLVKVYETMKPADAARIFEKLDAAVLLNVSQRMKPAKIALVLAQMNPDQAQSLTVRLARRLDLPGQAEATLASESTAETAPEAAEPAAMQPAIGGTPSP